MQAGGGRVREARPDDLAAPPDGWAWVDITVNDADVESLVALTSSFELDPIAVHDAVTDFDLPKLDDFGSHLLAIIHGLSDDRIESYEIDCFLTASRQLVTVHQADSPSIETLWAQVPQHPELATGGADELLARLADVATRRFLAVLDVFDDHVEGMIQQALAAEPSVVADVTAVRTDLGRVRRAVVPQREALDQLRSTTSPLLSDQARRRFSDVFDVSSRAAQGIDAARSSLAETLDAYRGAEAREATEVGKVLTVYAAVMLPLSLIAGFFGMNFENLPWTGSENGWIIISALMAVITLASLGMFMAAGWIRRPTARGAGVVLGRGLIEAARRPAQVVGGVYQVSTKTLRRTPRRSPDADGKLD